MAPPSSALTPPRSSVAPPPFSPVPPPPVATPPACGPIRAQSEAAEAEPELEEVMSVLRSALEAVRQNQRKKSNVVSDVEKRLTLFESSWCRLSLVVRRRMKKLSSELQSGRFEAADNSHRSLMVDHVTEVSQWMVGVKRLIAEVRELRPEQLRGLVLDPDLDQNQDPDLDSNQSQDLNQDKDLNQDLTQEPEEQSLDSTISEQEQS